MAQMLHCPLCGSDKVQPGVLQGTGPVHFSPGNAKFLKSESTKVEVTGVLCTQCGNIVLLADIIEAAKLTPEPTI